MRHKPPSLIYVEIDSNNGGILLNLGAGGLAFQPAGKITVKDDLALKFRLGEARQNTEVVGGIAWQTPGLGPVGIRFKEPSSAAQQQISEWIARQEDRIQVLASFSPPGSQFVPRSGSPSDSAAGTGQLPARGELPPPVPAAAAVDAEIIEHIPKRQWVLPGSLPTHRAPGHDHPSPAAKQHQAQERRWGLRMIAGSAVCMVLLILVLTVFQFIESRGRTPVQTTAPSQSSNQPSNATPATAVSDQPPAQTNSDWLWTGIVRLLIPGYGAAPKADISKEQATVSVWISKQNGYYYCSGSPDLQTSQPGSWTTQGEALQSGYQPKFGKLCY